MKNVFKSILKSSLCFILIFTMLSGMMVFAAGNDEPWDANYNPEGGTLMPFTPEDKYVTQQNPPDFKWGYVENATSYDIVIATDPELKNIKYRRDGLKNNYYNFNETFETGVLYYWAARYNIGNKASGWSTVRRFRIDPDAYEFTIPSSEELISYVPKQHPRTLISYDELDEIRAYKDKYQQSKEAYDALVKNCDKYIAGGVVDREFTQADIDAVQTNQIWQMKLLGLVQKPLDSAVEAAFLYAISGEEKYAKYAADTCLEIASWDRYGITSYANQDQVHREICYKVAIAYDLIYNYLTESERKTLANCVKERIEDMEYLLGNLKKDPFESHGKTCYGMIQIAAFAIFGDVPEATEWLDETMTGYAMLHPTWGLEDGAWSQGTDYWTYVNPIEGSNIFMPGMAKILKLHEKAYTQNRYLHYLYVYGPGSYGGFGDQSGRTLADKKAVPSIASADTYLLKNPVSKWLAEEFGSKYDGLFSQYLYVTEDLEAQPPYTYQLAHEFPDVGIVAMTDSLMSREKVKLMFRSSPFGSWSHGHADQNGFVIEAYGEDLAVNSGWYVEYGSAHDTQFTRKTHAHNTITFDNGKGQKDNDLGANGYISAFLTQEDFDLVQGDATDAYRGGLGKFVRNIIYIRPDMFIVIDDLKSKEGKENEFEWWLNAREEIKLYNEGNGARLQRGVAVLDATVQYPKKVKSFYNNIYAGADMVEYGLDGTRYEGNPVDTRVWFETEKTAATKMIVTLDVHRENVEARSVNTEYFDNYVKMVFEDGTVVLVNLGESTDEVVTADGYTFIGQAVVFNDDSIMLVGGTSLKEGEKELIKLEIPGSVVMGSNELSLSTFDDNKITVNTNNDYIREFKGATDYNGRELTKAIGISYTVDGEYVTFDAEKDNYQLMLNGKMITEEVYTTTAKVVIDGEEQVVELSGYKGRNGEAAYSGSIDLGGSKYRCISKTDDLTAGELYEGVVSSVGELLLTTSQEEGNELVLEKLPVFNLNTVADANYDAIKNTFAVFVEAENADGGNPDGFPQGAAPYKTRSFLSGGQGVSGFNTLGTNITYTFEIKEEGYYDFVVKYVAWEEGGAKRSFSINGADYIFNLPKTDDYGTVPEVWRAAVTNSNIHLTPGTYTLVMSPVQGQWNYDWFGFVKK